MPMTPSRFRADLLASLALAAILTLPAAAEKAKDKKADAKKGSAQQVAAPAAAAASAPKPITVEDLWAMERVGAPVVSPDGRWVVYAVNTFNRDKNAGTNQLWLVPTAGDAPPRRLTWHESGARAPVWSPDGQWLLFTAKRGGDLPPQLHRLPLGGGEAEQLTELPVSPSDARFLPDGKSLIFVVNTFADVDIDWKKLKERLDAQTADKTQAKISERRMLRFWDAYRTDGSTNHLVSLDLDTRQLKDLTPGQTLIANPDGGLDWDLSPDGKEVAISLHTGDPSLRTMNFDVHLLDLATGQLRNITQANPAGDGSVRYSPDGKYLLYGAGQRPDWPADTSLLMRYDRATGETRNLLPGWDREAGGWRVTPDGQAVTFVAQDQARQHLYKVSIDGGQPERLAAGGSINNAQPTAGGIVVYSREAYYETADLYAVSLTGGEPRRLTNHNADRLKAIARGKVENVTYAGAEGAQVQMYVLTPPDFDPKKKWPLMVILHGGPHGASMDGFHYRWSAEAVAARGYVVAVPNFHGSTGFGQAYADAIVGRHGDKPFTDVMNGVDLLIARGYIDEKRMAAAGGSYGGYLVSWILGHTDRFAALINHAGVFDLNAQFASDATWGRSFAYGADPWVDPIRIDEQSPSRFAANFKTPTLILHGEIDYRVPVTQGIHLYGILTGKGVPTRIVIFPQENHWILKPQSAELWWKEFFAWLDKYLGPGGPK
jgi:dipeptidyl aminopeptidase/acylaminoacyl peptidase